MEEWVSGCRLIYDKFHILQHANDAVDEVRRAEFFRKGRKMRDLIKGKKWLLLSRWKNLAVRQRGVLNRLFQLNRRVFKAYMLKESLERLWDYRYEGAMGKYLGKWPLNEARILKVIPDYQTVEDTSKPVAPMTAAQKWRLGWREAVDPFNFASAALTAGFSQHDNQTPRYGEGWANYGRRFAAAVADFGTQDFLTAGVFA